jgi:hypothetical protein
MIFHGFGITIKLSPEKLLYVIEQELFLFCLRIPKLSEPVFNEAISSFNLSFVDA